MPFEYEEELRLAVSEGMLSREEAEALREEALRLKRDPLELLLERGRLSEDTLASLRRAPLSAAPAEPAAQPVEASTLRPAAPRAATSEEALANTVLSPAPRASPPEAPAFPVGGWERYQPVRFLGQGGMGRVFLAYDPRLRRNVALKFVRDDDPELARHFLSEARAQARVSHERVCKVYEVGEVQGRAFIAMQYVDGRPLSQLQRELTLEQKVLMVRQVAEGLHEAHRAGLIHRDIKPSNILVERTGDGVLKPYLMDFGLARDWKDEATATGTVLGTPHYMAPEQARGEISRLDRRADVYSMGATLYFLLTGELPHPGSNALEVLTLIQSQEPRPPRAVDRDIPVDLEAIVLKCLEKERSARYDSARALAEDLERFLAGDVVRARPVGAAYRLSKWARKHRVAVSLGATALLALLMGVGQAVLARREAAVRERYSRQFTEKVERIEAMARYSGLTPLHDTREDRRALQAQVQALETEVRRADPRVTPLGLYALGRALLALGDEEAAQAQLESAWARGLVEPRVAYGLALVLGHRYQEQLLEVGRLRNAEVREARRLEVERRYRDPALAWLRRSEGAEVPSPHYVAALLAFYEGRHDAALSHLKSMGNTLPWFYEAPQLEGQVLVARATQRGNAGDRQGALADFEAARQAYAVASAIGRSVPTVHLNLAELELAAFFQEQYGQGNVQPHYERGLAVLAQALAAAPDHVPSLLLRARFHRRLAEYRTGRGEDVEALLDKALASSREALALEPDAWRARLEVAQGLWQQARFLQSRNKDPGEPLREALALFDSIREEERSYGYYVDLGLAYKLWADYEDDSGQDSLAHRGQAIASFESATRINERLPDAWINLGAAYFKRASHPKAEEADEDLERARATLERARTLNPGNYVAFYYGAQVHEQRARRLRLRGGDPGPDLEQAAALFQKGQAINPKVPQLHNGLGGVRMLRAQIAWDEGGDPFPLLAEAQAAYEQARAVAPQQGFASNNLGEVEAYRAMYLRARGEDPRPSVRAALQAYQQALPAMEKHAQLWANQGKVQQQEAAWVLERGGNPEPVLERAETALRRSLELNPKLGDAWRQLGEVRGLRARWLGSRGLARGSHFEEASQAFDKALELEPERPEFHIASGHFLREWAVWQRQAGEDPEPLLKRSLERAESQLAARPQWGNARVLRASVLLELSEAAPEPRSLRSQAVEDFDVALTRNPNLAPAWSGRLGPLRKQLAEAR
jgi:predicted Ser/Thr protein kinase